MSKSFTAASILLTLTFTLSQPAWSATSKDVEKALVDAKILAPDYRIVVELFEPEKEAMISTYVNQQSKDKDKDCKIDAMLIAKKVMELNPAFVRVKVRFYEFDQSRFNQVAVSKAHIVAFTSGGMTKDALLDSLEVTEQSTAPVRRSDNLNNKGLRGAQAVNPHSTERSQPSAGKHAGDANGSKGYKTFTGEGLTLYYPNGWNQGDPHSDGSARIVADERSSIYVEIKHRRTPPAEMLETDRERWSHDYGPNEQQLFKTEEITIGYKRIAAYSQLTNRKHDSHIESSRYVYFGEKGNSYRLKFTAGSARFPKYNADFNYMLSTISLTP